MSLNRLLNGPASSSAIEDLDNGRDANFPYEVHFQSDAALRLLTAPLTALMEEEARLVKRTAGYKALVRTLVS
jgi:hypothetical protein